MTAPFDTVLGAMFYHLLEIKKSILAYRLCIGSINTLFSLVHQVKKEINDADRPWSIESESPLCAGSGS